MKSLKLINGDLLFTNNELSMIDGKDEIAQSLAVIIQTRLGEFYLDETVGTNWDELLVKQFDEDAAHNTIVEAIMEDERVEEVTSVDFSISGRTLTVSVSLVTTDGDPVQLDGVSIDAGGAGGA